MSDGKTEEPDFKFSTILTEARWCASLRASNADKNPHIYQHVGGPASDIYSRERRIYAKESVIVKKPPRFKIFPASVEEPKGLAQAELRRSVHFNDMVVPPPLDPPKPRRKPNNRSVKLSPRQVNNLLVSASPQCF